jgi:hypothetical protein
LRDTPERDRVRAASAFFVEQIDQAATWLTTRARFDNVGQRDRLLHLFAEGRAWFERRQA